MGPRRHGRPRHAARDRAEEIVVGRHAVPRGDDAKLAGCKVAGARVQEVGALAFAGGAVARRALLVVEVFLPSASSSGVLDRAFAGTMEDGMTPGSVSPRRAGAASCKADCQQQNDRPPENPAAHGGPPPSGGTTMNQTVGRAVWWPSYPPVAFPKAFGVEAAGRRGESV